MSRMVLTYPILVGFAEKDFRGASILRISSQLLGGSRSFAVQKIGGVAALELSLAIKRR